MAVVYRYKQSMAFSQVLRVLSCSNYLPKEITQINKSLTNDYGSYGRSHWNNKFIFIMRNGYNSQILFGKYRQGHSL